ncbi:DUF6843 domain-containing protein [Bacillus coreaensis]
MKKLLVLLMILGLGACSGSNSTNNTVLLPEGFEGIIFVFYNIPGEEELQMEGDYTVIRVEQEALDELNAMGVKGFGTYFTSTPDMKYGTVTDKYYYVNKGSHRTPINNDCIHLSGTGVITTENGRDIPFSKMQVTGTNCTSNFNLRGSNELSNKLSEVESYLLDYISYTY